MMTKQRPLLGINIGTATTVAISELAGLSMIDLRVAPGTPSYIAVADALGIALPMKPGQSASITLSGGAEAYALCLGPDWWLLTGFELESTKLEHLNEHHFSAVDVSGQRTTIELEGPAARELLAHLWEQDLRDRSFPVGSVSQGVMANAPVILWHMATLRYRIHVRSSFAVHLWKCVEDAAAEWI